MPFESPNIYPQSPKKELENVQPLEIPECWDTEKVAKEMVADAVMAVHGAWLDLYLRRTSQDFSQEGTIQSLYDRGKTLEFAIESESRGGCVDGSVELLYQLLSTPGFEKYFRDSFLLVSGAGTYRDSNWQGHAYAVTRDNAGVWRAASPANMEFTLIL